MKYLLLFITVPVLAGNVQDYLYKKLHVEFLQKCELKNCNRNKKKKKKLRRYSDTALLQKSTKNAYKKKMARKLGWL